MKTRKTYGYARISLENDEALEAQCHRIGAWASIYDREPVEEIITDNGCTGANTERPGLQRLEKLIRAGQVSAVIVVKLDRLSRSLYDVLDFIKICEKHKTVLLSVSENLDTSNAMGMFLIQLLGSFSEFERNRIVERTSESLAHKRKSGKAYTRIPPYGYTRQGSDFIPEPSEQKWLAMMRDLRAQGLAFDAIAATLNEKGCATRSGQPWYRQVVRKVLTSAMVAESA